MVGILLAVKMPYNCMIGFVIAIVTNGFTHSASLLKKFKCMHLLLVQASTYDIALSVLHHFLDAVFYVHVLFHLSLVKCI